MGRKEEAMPRGRRACMRRGTFPFFFQAEDGIRDLYVTGVQTCALPISARDAAGNVATGSFSVTVRDATSPAGTIVLNGRSEERRVGKECRPWRAPYR